jgi:hypothetical protein
LISTTLVNPITCNIPQPTQDGGKSGSTTVAILPTSETTRRSLSVEVKIKKLNQFGLTTSTRENIHHNSGRSFILITWVMKLIRLRDWIKTSALESMKNSIWDPNFQCKELSNVLELITLSSRNGIRTERPSNGNSTQLPRLSTT